ncbi:hypothetical protein U9M48_014235 [Paspalum notatum var. saurae]|uniref:Secreted protein n=1 Tax=Paspalum notatum var. saurae TaxID=547442 RepID=A0AAQ3T289_PASNO
MVWMRSGLASAAAFSLSVPAPASPSDASAYVSASRHRLLRHLYGMEAWSWGAAAFLLGQRGRQPNGIPLLPVEIRSFPPGNSLPTMVFCGGGGAAKWRTEEAQSHSVERARRGV